MDEAAEKPRRRGKQPVDWTTEADEPTGESDRDARRRAGREQADEASELASRLIACNELAFPSLPLDEELRTFALRLRAMRADSARRRHIRSLAGMLRLRDRRALQEAFARIEAGKGVESEAFHAWETWRERLLREGDPALDALVATYPDADRQALRTLVRQARKEQAEGAAPRAFRELFRALRRLGDGPTT